jgi:hypothetical protein
VATTPYCLTSLADTAPSGTTADVSVQPLDNTHTIIVKNDGTNAIYVNIVPTGTALGAGSPRLAAGDALTWRIGTVTERAGGSFDTNAIQKLRISGIGGTSATQVTYLNSAYTAPA